MFNLLNRKSTFPSIDLQSTLNNKCFSNKKLIIFYSILSNASKIIIQKYEKSSIYHCNAIIWLWLFIYLYRTLECCFFIFKTYRLLETKKEQKRRYSFLLFIFITSILFKSQLTKRFCRTGLFCVFKNDARIVNILIMFILKSSSY